MPFVTDAGAPIVLSKASAIYVGGVHIVANGVDPDALAVDLWSIADDGRRAYLTTIPLSGDNLTNNPSVVLWTIILDAIEESAPMYAEMLAGLKRVSEQELGEMLKPASSLGATL